MERMIQQKGVNTQLSKKPIGWRKPNWERLYNMRTDVDIEVLLMCMVGLICCWSGDKELYCAVICCAVLWCGVMCCDVLCIILDICCIERRLDFLHLTTDGSEDRRGVGISIFIEQWLLRKRGHAVPVHELAVNNGRVHECIHVHQTQRQQADWPPDDVMWYCYVMLCYVMLLPLNRMNIWYIVFICTIIQHKL